MKRKANGNLKVKEEEETMAEVDRILKEKGSGKKKQYLCSWVDGAKAQWVSCEYLIGTDALDEWNEACEDIPEEFDSEDVVNEKCAILIKWLRESKRTSFLVGAGLSAPVLPTFRGKGGLWTRNPSYSKVSSKKPKPTLAHNALAMLEKKTNHVTWVASQNYDDLFHDCAFPASKLSELHGNVYVEHCKSCNSVYHREYEVALSSSINHETGRHCEKEGCNRPLYDNIVHFGESLPWKDLIIANAKFLGSELTIVLGSSLRVEPAASLPFKAKRRARKGSEAESRLHSVIINLQPTPRDEEADLVIRARCDDVMERVVTALIGSDWNNQEEDDKAMV